MAAKALADTRARGRRVEDVLPRQQAVGLRRGPDRRHPPALAGARQSRPGQEQLRRDRLQQGAGVLEAARVSRGRLGVPGRRPRTFSGRMPTATPTWRDLLGADRRRGAAGRSTASAGTSCCAPACRWSSSGSTVRDGKIARLELAQRPVAAACRARGRGPSAPRCCSPIATAPPVRIPVELRGPVTEVAAARRPSRARFRASPTRATTATSCCSSTRPASSALERRRARPNVDDAFLRAMLWGALWDQVRDSRMEPERFVRLALRELPRETDEQIVPVVLAETGPRGRGLSLAGRAAPRCSRTSSACCGRARADTARAYGVRKAYLDAFIGLAESPDGVARLDTLLVGRLGGGRAAPRPDPLGHRDPAARRWARLGAERALDRAGPARHHARRPAAGVHRRRRARPSAADEARVLHPLLRRLDAQRGVGVGQPGRVQCARAPGADVSVSPPGARFASLHPGPPPDLLSRELAGRVPAGPDGGLRARRGAGVSRRTILGCRPTSGGRCCSTWTSWSARSGSGKAHSQPVLSRRHPRGLLEHSGEVALVVKSGVDRHHGHARRKRKRDSSHGESAVGRCFAACARAAWY